MIATPLEKSMPSSGVTTPKSASLLVRTSLPSFSLRRGRPFGSSLSRSKSGRVPMTPPAKTTRSAVKVRAFLSKLPRVSIS